MPTVVSDWQSVIRPPWESQRREYSGQRAQTNVGPQVERVGFMELSHVLAVIAGWTALSVPVSLVIGAFMARGNHARHEIAVPVRAEQS